MAIEALKIFHVRSSNCWVLESCSGLLSGVGKDLVAKIPSSMDAFERTSPFF